MLCYLKTDSKKEEHSPKCQINYSQLIISLTVLFGTETCTLTAASELQFLLGRQVLRLIFGPNMGKRRGKTPEEALVDFFALNSIHFFLVNVKSEKTMQINDMHF